MKTKLRKRISAVGCCFAVVYSTIVVVLFAATTHPSKVGLDWFPMFLLAMPWYALDRRLLLHGFVANIILLYLLGAILKRTSCIVREWESNLRNHGSTWGCCLAAAYISIVIVVFAVTAATTNPSKMGWDWIPFTLLAWPWPGLDARLLGPGFILNMAFMYALGAILQEISLIVEGWG